MTKEQISPVTLCSVALFLKIDGIDSLSLLFTKERREQIAPIALYKRATVSESIPSIFKKATGAICFFSQANQSFHPEKQVIRSKNW